MKKTRPERKYHIAKKSQTLIYFGDGKGKTTAALGAILRAVGYGWQCHVYQFIKGPWPSGERDAITQFLSKHVTIETGGKGFVGIQNDRLPKKDHKQAARELWKKALERVQGSGNRAQTVTLRPLYPVPSTLSPCLIVLDELLDAVDLGFVSEKEVTDLIKNKPNHIHLIITGHKKFPKIFAAADLITEMKKTKHPFDQGFLAIRGLDY